MIEFSKLSRTAQKLVRTPEQAEADVRGAYRHDTPEEVITDAISAELDRLRILGLLRDGSAWRPRGAPVERGISGILELVDMDNEEWRPLVDYPESHEVSNWGRIRTVDRMSHGFRPREVIGRDIVLRSNAGGTMIFSVTEPGIDYPISKTVKKSVMQAFGEYPVLHEGRVVIRNRDGDPENCRLDNLEYYY